jgi:septal ring factor EnvC (AmiA/AmiB activator)
MLTKADMPAAPPRLSTLRLSQLIAGVFLVLALAGFGFLLLEVRAMRTGLESTNAALARTNVQLERTNRGVAAMGRQLAATNRLLTEVRGQLGTTNAKLSTTNAKLAATNVQIRAMARRITRAKLLF